MATKQIRPQKGPQEQFLSTPADIAIYGGAAGAGKTWAILLEPLRHITKVADFATVIFRRTTPQIKNAGGLWDASMQVYPLSGAKPTNHVAEWNWPKGGKLKMTHLEHESNVLDWQGSEIPLIVFDELTHFTMYQFFYLLSRNRSMCGVRPYVRATCNPDADSWVAEFIAWWIDQDTGFPIPERSGRLRWFVRLNDVIIWANSKDELIESHGVRDDNGNLLANEHEDQIRPKSITFIPGKLSDNPALMKADPDYLANLKALPLVEQERLLGGNWKIRPAAGLMFRRSWCEVVDAVPANLNVVRYWDLAATEKTDNNDPDWTVGFKLGKDPDTGLYYWLDTVMVRESPHKVRQIMKNTASGDGRDVAIGIPQDPGQAGKSQSKDMVSQLAGYTVRSRREQGKKEIRFGPFSAQCEAGNVKVLRGPWNDAAFSQLEGFPDPKVHDDVADGASGAFDMHNNTTFGLLDYYKEQGEEVQKVKSKEVGEDGDIKPVNSGVTFMNMNG